MEMLLKPKKKLRSKLGAIATALALALAVGTFSTGPAYADNHHGDRDHDGDHHDNGNHGRRGPNVYYSSRPDYYYAPQPNYYSSPEPYQYYGSDRQYAAPSQGISLFFGL
jgi:hypothetical protein